MQDWILDFLFTCVDAPAFSEIVGETSEFSQHTKYADYLCWTYEPPKIAKDQKQDVSEQVDTSALELMTKQLEFKHEFPKSEQPAKYSVTALSHADIVTESIDEENRGKAEILTSVSENKPLTLEQAKTPNLTRRNHAEENRIMNAAQRGTAVHTVMQHLDFESALQNPVEELECLQSEKLITEAQRKVMRPQQLEAFLSSELCQRILSAQKAGNPICKEKQIFAMIADLNLPEKSPLALQYADTDGVLIGTMDLIFRENDGWVIVDYKTNRCSAEELIEKYQGQLWLYRKATELILGEPVKQTYLYSFHLGEALEVK